jgi:hypothetical protein
LYIGTNPISEKAASFASKVEEVQRDTDSKVHLYYKLQQKQPEQFTKLAPGE